MGLKIGVVGAGYIAEKFHLPILTRENKSAVNAICDIDETRLLSTAGKFGIQRTYHSFDEMLASERLDLVDILTPPDTHATLCAKALESGINCLVEKPFTTSVKDADRLISLSKSSSKKLEVIHNYSFVPAFAKAREMVRGGELGEFLCVDGFYSMPHEEVFLQPNHWTHRIPGDVLGEVAPHFTMLALEYLGKVKLVKAIVRKRGEEPAIRFDELKMLLESEAGLGSVTVMLGPGGETRRAYLNILGTKGSLYADGESQALVKYAALKEGWSAYERGRRALSDIGQRLGSLVSTAWKTSTGSYQMATFGHRYLIRKSIESLVYGSEYPVSLELCREEVRVLEEAFSQAGKW